MDQIEKTGIGTQPKEDRYVQEKIQSMEETIEVEEANETPNQQCGLEDRKSRQNRRFGRYGERARIPLREIQSTEINKMAQGKRKWDGCEVTELKLNQEE